MAAGDSSLAALSLEAVKGFRAFADGEAEHVSGLTAPDPGTVRVGADHPAVGAARASCRARCSRWSTRRPSAGDLADLDLSGAWTRGVGGRRRPRARQPSRATGASRRSSCGPTTTRTPPTRRSRTVTSTGPRCRPSSYERGGGGVRRRRLRAVPGRAVLRDERRARRRCASQPVRQAIMLAIDRDAIVEAVYADLADPLATVVPAGVPGHDPDRCPSCAPDPERGGRHHRLRLPRRRRAHGAHRLRRDARPGGDGGARRRRPRGRRHPHASSGLCRSRSTRRSWCPATRSSSASGGSAPTCRPTPTSPRCSDRRPTTTSPATGPTRSTACSSGARASTNSRQNARAVGRWPSRPVLEAAVVVPIAQFRIQVVVADRVRGPPARRGRHRRLGPGEPHRLIQAVGRSGGVRATVTSPQGRPGGHVGVAELADAPA